MTEDQVRPVQRLLADMNQIRSAVELSPNDESPAAQERRAFPRPLSIDTLNSHANVLIESAADNLQALDRLVESQDLSVAPWACARASLEAAALAVWLLDRSVDTQERVGRSLALRYEALHAQEKLARVDTRSGKLAAVIGRIDELEVVAIGIGFPPIRNKRNERIGVGVKKPLKSLLVSALLESDVLYGIFSGVVHSDVVTLSELCFRPTGDVSARGIRKARAPNPEIHRMLLARVAAAYARP